MVMIFTAINGGPQTAANYEHDEGRVFWAFPTPFRQSVASQLAA